MAYCTKCGTGSNGAFCPQCGTPMAAATPHGHVHPQQGYPPQQPKYQAMSPQPYSAPPPPKRSNGLVVGLGIAAGVVALGLVAVVVMSGMQATPSNTPSGAAPASNPSDSATKLNRKPGYVTGVVLDERGVPLKVSGDKVNIRISGTRASDMQQMSGLAEVQSDGRFEMKVPDGSYKVTGFVKIDFQGTEFWLSLDPVGGSDLQSSKEGIFKEMRLKLSGLRPGFDAKNPYSYYGGHVRMQYQGRTLPDDAQVKFTLTPTTSLADGTQGKPFTFTATGQQLRGNAPFMDIPLAKYRITGEVTLANGTKKIALISQATGNPAPSQEFMFQAASGGEGVEGIFLWMMGEQ